MDPTNLLHITSNGLSEAQLAGRPFLVTSAYPVKFIQRFCSKSKPLDLTDETASG